MAKLRGKKINGQVIWITGLSGSGKTTLAKELLCGLKRNNRNAKSILLDGDDLRIILDRRDRKSIDYSLDSRLELSMRYCKLCKYLSEQDFTVIVATISMFRQVYEWNRKNLPRYYEIYLKTPIEELKRRNNKSIYSDFEEGLLSNVAGLDLPIDEPNEAHMVLNFREGQSTRLLAEKLLIEIADADYPDV